MSITTTSGLSSSGLLHGRGAVAGLGDDRHVGLAVDEQLQPVAHRHVVVGEQDRGAALCAQPWSRPSGRRRRRHAARGWSCPCRAPIRSRASRRPAPRAPASRAGRSRGAPSSASAGSNPTPSSSTIEQDASRRGRSRMTSTRVAPRVLGDVGQRFLRDAVQRRFDFRRQPIVEQARRVQLRRNADARATSPGRSWPAPRAGRGRRAPSAGAPRRADRRRDRAARATFSSAVDLLGAGPGGPRTPPSARRSARASAVSCSPN